MTDIKKNLLLFFDRPTEPCFMPKSNLAVFQLPPDYFPKKFQAAREILAKRFGKDATRIIPIKKITIPDLSVPLQLPYMATFSLFIPWHRQMATALVNIFMGMKNLEELQSVAAYCQMRINPYLFNYSLSVALLNREDTKNLNFPTLVSSFPDKFIDPRVMKKAREVSFIYPVNKRLVLEIPPNYTAAEWDPEQRVAYFREDIGVNLHHWHWHLVYPTDGSHAIVAKDRRGELFYYMHQQIIARYTIERFCNKLSAPEPLHNFREPIKEGYFPKMDSTVASRYWPPRFASSFMSDLNRTKDGIIMEITQLEYWRDRIVEAIDSMSILMPGGHKEPLDETTGIDILGNIVEASILSPNPGFYGNLHNMGHNFLSFMHDPDNKFKEEPSIMGDVATAMRDPVFYRWHAFIDDIFQLYKNKLPPYVKDQLNFHGIQVTKISIACPGDNTINTQWEQSTLELSHGLDFTYTILEGKLLARFTHLTHDEFTYNIEVQNTGKDTIGTVRLFMAPTQDENGTALGFQDQRRLMIELDKFTHKLPAGCSRISRSSVKSSVTIPYERTFQSQANRPGQPDVSQSAELQFCGCGWPHHLLVPKGTTEGFPMVIFCMISNWEDDKVEQDTGTCNDAASYCGLRDRKYPDRRAMGFPFDRPTPANTLSDFLTPNMNVCKCVIRFKDEVRQREPKEYY
ncbi:unnamed protein product [Colias eurytheme]|nr:unnamed protein product [Colias eurytheme]